MVYDVSGNRIDSDGGSTTIVGKTYSPILDEAQIIGHQANSISKFLTYKNSGLKFIECDVMISGDNIPLLAHNDNFTVNGTTYYISQMTYTDIAATGAGIDTLSDLLMNCKKFNVALYLDIKNGTTSNISAVYNLVREWGMLPMTVFGTISTTVAAVLGEINPQLIFDFPGGNSSTIDRAIRELPECALIIMNYGTHSNLPSETYIDTLKYAHQLGVKSYNWTVNDAAVANANFNVGADYVMSNSLSNSDIA